MKADWDDAPHYLRQRNTGPNLALVIIGGCVVTAAALFIGAKFLKVETPPPAPAVSEPYVPKYNFEEPPAPTGPTPEERFWADVERSRQPKQTVFNDSNYAPKSADNVVSTAGIRQSAAYRDTRSQESRPTRRMVEHDSQWIREWSGEKRYQANWTATNNRIDSHSVCANHKRGSINYRECRKAAKQFFHEQCRAWRARHDNDRDERSWKMEQRYCSAANGFSPMG